MKILAFNSLYAPQFYGGAEVVMQSRVEAVTKLGVKAKVVCLGTTDKSYEMNGVPVQQTRIENIYWPFKDRPKNPLKKALWHTIDAFNPLVFAKTTSLLKLENPDLIETSNLQGFSPSVWLAASRLGIPILHHMQDHYLMCPRILMSRNNKNCETRCGSCSALSSPKKFASSLVMAVTAVSGYLLNRHLEEGYFSSAQFREVFPNSLQPSSFVVRKSVDSGAPLRLGFLGRLMPEKGIELAINSLMENPDKQWTLLVAGPAAPAYEAYLRAKYTDPRVQFLGIQKAEELLSRIDMLLVPSLFPEPSARVIIEALAASVPVLGSKAGGTPELVHEGKTGYLFNSEAEFKEKLGFLLRNAGEVRALSRSCREFAEAFSQEASAKKLVHLYNQMVTGLDKERGRAA